MQGDANTYDRVTVCCVKNGYVLTVGHLWTFLIVQWCIKRLRGLRPIKLRQRASADGDYAKIRGILLLENCLIA
jgi:hypothetical protein